MSTRLVFLDPPPSFFTQERTEISLSTPTPIHHFQDWPDTFPRKLHLSLLTANGAKVETAEREILGPAYLLSSWSPSATPRKSIHEPRQLDKFPSPPTPAFIIFLKQEVIRTVFEWVGAAACIIKSGWIPRWVVSNSLSSVLMSVQRLPH